MKKYEYFILGNHIELIYLVYIGIGEIGSKSHVRKKGDKIGIVYAPDETEAKKLILRVYYPTIEVFTDLCRSLGTDYGYTSYESITFDVPKDKLEDFVKILRDNDVECEY